MKTVNMLERQQSALSWWKGKKKSQAVILPLLWPSCSTEFLKILKSWQGSVQSVGTRQHCPGLLVRIRPSRALFLGGSELYMDSSAVLSSYRLGILQNRCCMHSWMVQYGQHAAHPPALHPWVRARPVSPGISTWELGRGTLIWCAPMSLHVMVIIHYELSLRFIKP